MFIFLDFVSSGGRVWGWGDMCKILIQNALFAGRVPCGKLKKETQTGILAIGGGGNFDNLMHFFHKKFVFLVGEFVP